MDLDDNKYYLEHDQIPDEKDSEYDYETIPDEEFDVIADEDLATTVRVLQEAAEDKDAEEVKPTPPKASLTERLPPVDDFVRSFLLKLGLNRTLDTFQLEWYELMQKGLLKEEDVTDVPDVYIHNQQLDDELKHQRVDRDKYKAAALKAREMYIKLRNERDFHKLHHRRVAQEKNKLLNDLKRLKHHYASYEPALQQLRKKYEAAMREKMLSQLERDRAMGQVNGLQATLKSLEHLRRQSGSSLNPLSLPNTTSIHACQRGGTLLTDAQGQGPTQRKLVEARLKSEIRKDVGAFPSDYKRHPNDIDFPSDPGVNPLLLKVAGPPTHLTRTGGFKQTSCVRAHSDAISGLALHPTQPRLCTTSDDRTWKMWQLPAEGAPPQLLHTAQGPKDWLSSVTFSPDGTRLATGSGDSTVCLWDADKGNCVKIFNEHSQSVWSVSWHSAGQHIASASMDNTVKIWDLGSSRCRVTFRAHADSVNSVNFLPFSNTLISGSADKTVVLWDARTSSQTQTFYGHLHSINSVAFSMRGDLAVSCDSFGFLYVWDIRTSSPIASLDLGPHPANHCCFDSSGACIAVASNDGNIKMVEAANGHVTQLSGHEDAVHATVFDFTGEMLVSGASDNTIRVWT